MLGDPKLCLPGTVLIYMVALPSLLIAPLLPRVPWLGV